MKQFLEVGKLNNTHGIKGELKMQLWCDDIEFLKQFKTLYFDDKGQNSVEITSVRSQKNLAIIKLKGIDSIEQAETVKGKILYCNRDDASIDEERKTDILLKYTINALAYSEMRIRPFLPMYNPIIFLKRDYDVSKECIRKIWRFKREGSKLVPTDES